MTSSFARLYRQLFLSFVSEQDIWDEGGELEEFMSPLVQEGVIIHQKEGRLYWEKGGFGAVSLQARFSCPVYFTQSCVSTNDWAREFVRTKGIREGIFVCTDQTAGRGRLGREWKSSEQDSLICSFVCTPKINMERVSICSLVWMAEIAYRLGIFVKWPNDLMSSSGKKIGGCLVELIDHQPMIIFGIGINVGHKVSPLATASSLHLEDLDIGREEVLSIIHDVVFDQNISFSLDRWKTLALYLGQKIRVRDIEGIMTGVRDDGALLIDGRPVLTGDVELVEDRRCSW